MGIATNDISGIWHSCYWYPNTKHDNREDTSEYYVLIERMSNSYAVHSLKSLNVTSDAYLEGKLEVDNQVVTGTWREDTSKTDAWAGIQYKGVFQFMLSEDGTKMEGQWITVGYNNGNPKLFNGRWEFSRVDEATANSLQKEATAKV